MNGVCQWAPRPVSFHIRPPTVDHMFDPLTLWVDLFDEHKLTLDTLPLGTGACDLYQIDSSNMSCCSDHQASRALMITL